MMFLSKLKRLHAKDCEAVLLKSGEAEREAEQRAAELEKALRELRSAKAACFPSSAAAQNAWIERIDNAERMADEALNGGGK